MAGIVRNASRRRNLGMDLMPTPAANGPSIYDLTPEMLKMIKGYTDSSKTKVILLSGNILPTRTFKRRYQDHHTREIGIRKTTQWGKTAVSTIGLNKLIDVYGNGFKLSHFKSLVISRHIETGDTRIRLTSVSKGDYYIDWGIGYTDEEYGLTTLPKLVRKIAIWMMVNFDELCEGQLIGEMWTFIDSVLKEDVNAEEVISFLMTKAVIDTTMPDELTKILDSLYDTGEILEDNRRVNMATDTRTFMGILEVCDILAKRPIRTTREYTEYITGRFESKPNLRDYLVWACNSRLEPYTKFSSTLRGNFKLVLTQSKSLVGEDRLRASLTLYASFLLLKQKSITPGFKTGNELKKMLEYEGMILGGDRKRSRLEHLGHVKYRMESLANKLISG